MLTASDVVNRQAPATAWQALVVEAVIAALFVGYGSWLLRRTTRREAQPRKTDEAPVENAGDAGAAPTRKLARR